MKIKNRLLLISLLSMLGITGCSNDEKINNIEIESEEITTDENITELEETIENIVESSCVVTLEETDAYQEEIIDPKTELINLIDSGDIKKVYYVTSDTNLTIPSYLSDSGSEESVNLPRLECLEVYDQIDNICLVKTNEHIGYVNTDSLEELLGTFVVVDISNQELKLYRDNEIVLTTPVVTGKPSSPSDQGIFEIYNISGPRYLIGPNYKTYVDVMMKYNGGEGLHDAQYHQHEDGYKHGWRDVSEFGGETYLTDGSHGCINMLHDDVMTVREHVEIGTKVLVKQ